MYEVKSAHRELILPNPKREQKHCLPHQKNRLEIKWNRLVMGTELELEPASKQTESASKQNRKPVGKQTGNRPVSKTGNKQNRKLVGKQTEN